MLVCALGDLLLDVIVRLEQPLSPGDDATAETHLEAGGQAANVAAWAVALGAQGRLVAKLGRDDAGAFAASELARRGVELLGPASVRTGTVVALVEPGGERTMASDRGASPELRPEELDDAWFECDSLHLSGYSLMREPIASAATHAARVARARGTRISADLSSSAHIHAHGDAMRAALDAIRPDVLFGNEREWNALGDFEAPTIVIKRGARGISVNGKDREARATEVVDTTGAGDALAAGFLVGGAALALEAAARCVAQVGAMP